MNHYDPGTLSDPPCSTRAGVLMGVVIGVVSAGLVLMLTHWVYRAVVG